MRFLTRYAAADDIHQAGRKRQLKHMRGRASLAVPEGLVDAALAAANPTRQPPLRASA